MTTALAIPFNQPVASAEFYASSLVTGDVPSLSLGSQTRFVLRKINGVNLSAIVAPDTARMVVSCSIPMC